MGKILIASAETPLRQSLTIQLTRHEHEILTATCESEAVTILEGEPQDLLILDIGTNGMNSPDSLTTIRRACPDIEVILLSNLGQNGGVSKALEAGVFDIVTRPFRNDQLVTTLEKALEHRRLVRENRELREKLVVQSSAGQPVAESPEMQRVLDVARKIAAQDLPVVISGEPGVGKKTLAGMIHSWSARRHAPCLTVNCAGMPPKLLEQELYGEIRVEGHEAIPGLLEQAAGGTLVIAELQEMPLGVQGRLNDSLEENLIPSAQGSVKIPLNLRLIVTTTRDLSDLVKAGKVREELYHRLDIAKLHVPSLAERKDDIVPLAEGWLRTCAQECGKPNLTLSKAAIQTLLAHNWPGNLAELISSIRRAVSTASGERIESEDLILIPPTASGRFKLEFKREGESVSLEDSQKDHILKVLVANDWNYTRTSKHLGIGRTTLWRKVKKYGLQPQTAEQEQVQTG